MGSDVEMENSAPVMSQNQEDVEDLEPNCWHSEEIDRDQTGRVVLQKSAPSLRRRSSQPHHVLRNAGLGNLDAELEQFAMDAWSAPERIFPAHGTNQLADLVPPVNTKC